MSKNSLLSLFALLLISVGTIRPADAQLAAPIYSWAANAGLLPSPYAVTQRPPTPFDDWTKGYVSLGGISDIKPVTLGAGCTAATVTIAPGSGDTTGAGATANAYIVGGQVVAYKITAPGTNYTKSPTLTVTGTGCTTAPAAMAQLAGQPLWYFNDVVYVGAQTNITGAARWQPIQQYASHFQQSNQASFATDRQLPCDSGLNLEGFSMNLCAAAYTANKTVDLTRVSDSTVQTIGFVAGLFDSATANKFCFNTVCRVTTWYNQIGANNATQTTLANAPFYSPGNMIGRSPAIVFPASANGANVSTWLNLTNSGTTFEQGNGGCALFRATSAYRPTAVFAQTGGGTNFTLASAGQAAGGGQPTPYTITGSGQSALNLGQTPRQTPSVTCWRTTNAAATFYPNDKIVIGPAFSSSTLTATIIGASNTSTPEQYMEISALIIAQENNWQVDAPLLTRAGLVRNFQLTPQVRGTLLEDGDSITEGAGSQYQLNTPRYLENLLSRPVNIFQAALYGDTIAHRLAIWPSNVPSAFDFNAVNNIDDIFAGCNDLAGGVTATTAYANLTAYVALAHQLPRVKVAVDVMLPRGDLTAPQQTQWLSYQSLIRANTAGADQVIDLGSDPYMGVFANTSNLEFYQSDTIHPSPWEGYEFIAVKKAQDLTNVLH